MVKGAASRQPGFSMVELVIGLAIFLLVLLGIYQLFDTGSATYRSGQRRADVQQNARVALDETVRQLRMAGYFPENFDANPANDLPSTAMKVQVATSNGLAVLGDTDGSGESRVLLFCLNGSTVIRKWAVTGGAVTGPAAAYTCSVENVPNQRVGDVLAESITGLTFTYYDATNTLIPVPATNPPGLDDEGLGAVPAFGSTTNRGNVRTMVITLTAREDIPHQAPQIYTLTSSVRLRNVN
jgi:prepilin-type N-terminal cleavage/methylation domain-containing protein